MIERGRHTAVLAGDVVVFLIGMRVNRPRDVRGWGPVFMAMPRMLRELQGRPDLGLLHASFAWIDGPAVVQYWRSFAALEAYAKAPDHLHLPAWRRFNRAARASGSAGVWHETYTIRAGEWEAIYVNVPRRGLARAGELRPVGSTSSASERIAAPAR